MALNIVGEHEEKYPGQYSTHLHAVELGNNLGKVMSTDVVQCSLAGLVITMTAIACTNPLITYPFSVSNRL